MKKHPNVRNIRFDDDRNPMHIDHFRALFCEDIKNRLFFGDISTNELRKIMERLRVGKPVMIAHPMIRM
jgi:hypothetical protein